MRPPRVSVLMPVRNGEPFIADAIESVIGQTVADWELIIVENGSTDATARIASEFSAQDSRIRTLSAGDIGLVAALNLGLSEARGEYIARMDADDVADSTRLERQTRFLDEHPECVVVGTAYRYMDESGEVTGRRRVVRSSSAIRAEMCFGNPIGHSTVMLAPDRVDGSIEYSDRYPDAEDLELWLRLSEKGTIANIAAPLLSHRVHSSAVTQLVGNRSRPSSIRALADRSTWANAESIFDATFNPARVGPWQRLRGLWKLNMANSSDPNVARLSLFKRSVVAAGRPIRDDLRRLLSRRA